MSDRQKLAETVREAMTTLSGYTREGWQQGLAALDALAQPCQECEALREKLAAAERERDEARARLEARIEDDAVYRVYDEQVDRAETAERQLAEAREALRKIIYREPVRWVEAGSEVATLQRIARAALAAAERVPQQTEEER